MKDLRPKVLKLVEELADPIKWNWTRTASHRDAADAVLRDLARLGIIEHREHKLGGHVWIFEGQIFGRTDGVVLPDTGLVPLRK
jgi:hypothetical protein